MRSKRLMSFDCLETRAMLDAQMGSVTPQYALPPLPQDNVTVESMTLDNEDDLSEAQGFPNNSDAFVPYDVPADISSSTDDSGFNAGVIGSSWTGDVDPLPLYSEPTAIPPVDPFD